MHKSQLTSPPCMIIRVFTGCEVLIENSVMRLVNFQFAPKNHYEFFFLHTLPSTISCRLEYVLFYLFYAKITIFFDPSKFAMALLLYLDVETFGGNWRENDVNMSNITSKSSYWHHARVSSYTPHVRRHFLAPVGFTEILVGYARRHFLSPVGFIEIPVWYARKSILAEKKSDFFIFSPNIICLMLGKVMYADF